MPPKERESESLSHRCIWKEIAFVLIGVILSAIISLLIVIASQHK